MPFFKDYQTVQHLYNPAQRLRHFPRADWAFLVHTARNVAAAFEEVHNLGCLMGDVNQSNVLVSPQAVAGLIDCDSFQVRAGKSLFLCEVGVPMYTPPELQGKAFRGLERTPNHDRFGLAVLLFQLLFVGRHPYAGRFLGQGEPAFEQLIREYRFAYGSTASQLLMDRPPFTPALAEVSGEVGQLFERAFLPGSESANARPSATEWVRALDSFRTRLKPCPVEPGHRTTGTCVWCAIMAGGGPDYFQGVAAVAVVFVLDRARLNDLDQRAGRALAVAFVYRREDFRPATPPVAAPAPQNPPEYRLRTRLFAGATGLGTALLLLGRLAPVLGSIGFIVLLVFGVWLGVHIYQSPRRKEYRRRAKVLADAERQLLYAENDWQREAWDYQHRSTKPRQRVEKLRVQCQKLEARYSDERKKLERDREKLAREQYLKDQFLDDADIPNIGAGRKQILAAFNVETAFDIEEDRILAIKGFGPGLTAHLLKWKKQVSAEFKFDPKSGVPEADLRALALKYQREQDAAFADLGRAIGELESATAEAEKRLRSVEGPLRDAVARHAQAAADEAAFRR
jgi:DNA-binding helix-hairpin-helix protein with protein kinase domain